MKLISADVRIMKKKKGLKVMAFLIYIRKPLVKDLAQNLLNKLFAW